MVYACTSCGKEREIRNQDAWPESCSCGNRAWTSTPVDSSYLNVGTIDPAHASSALLRQPGSALGSFRNTGATATST